MPRTDLPERVEGTRKSNGNLRFLASNDATERRSEVCLLRVEPRQPCIGVLCPKLGFCRLRELEKVVHVPLGDLRPAAPRQPVSGILPDRLEHPVAGVSEANEALFDERLQGVEVGVGDLLCRLEGAASGEDTESGEELLLSDECHFEFHTIQVLRRATRAKKTIDSFVTRVVR